MERPCDQLISFSDRTLGTALPRHAARVYLRYYGTSRTHLSLGKDAPEERTVQSPELGPVIELAEVGGLHHRYERRAA